MYQLNIMLHKNCLRIFDIKLNEMNGGSIRFFISHKNSGHVNKNPNILKIKKIEKKYLFKLKINLRKFKKNITKSKRELKNFVHKNKKEKKIIHLYGASTKGNIILQYCRLTKKDIKFAADRNSEKWGRETPGSKIPIISRQVQELKNRFLSCYALAL